MLSPELYFQYFHQLPPLMQQLLVNKKLQASLSTIVRSNDLTDEQRRQAVLLVGDASVKAFPIDNFYNKITTEANIVDDKGKKVTIELLGNFFLPLQWYLGNVEKIITDLGGDAQHYTAEAQKNYPEVYAPDAQKVAEQAERTNNTYPTDQDGSADPEEPVILRDIGEKLGSSKGRAGILLHLVALSQKIEEAGKSGKISDKETGELLHGLDALSYAINTQDLNPLEIAAIKRRLKTIMTKIGE